MIRRVGNYPYGEVQATCIHGVLSLIAWSVVDTAVLDKTWKDEEVLQAYTFTWEEAAQTLMEESEWLH